MNKLVAVVFLVSGLAVFSGQSWAQPGFGRSGPPPMDNLDRLDMLADEIGLTEEQGTEISRIVNEAQLASAVDRERMKQIKDELKQMVDNFDAGQAQILADELGEISARLAYKGAESRAAVHQVFSDEQILMLEQLRAEHESERGHFGNRSHPSFGGDSRGFPPSGDEG
jgi:Spy/CpxP family protein refolding chaperone